MISKTYYKVQKQHTGQGGWPTLGLTRKHKGYAHRHMRREESNVKWGIQESLEKGSELGLENTGLGALHPAVLHEVVPFAVHHFPKMS